MHLKNGCWFRHVNEGAQIKGEEKVKMKWKTWKFSGKAEKIIATMENIINVIRLKAV